MLRWCFILVFLLVSSLLSPGSARAQGFSEGDTIGDYRVERVETHPEFHRLDITGPDGTWRVEITYAAQAGFAGATTHYLVQAAPGEPAPPDLLETVRVALDEMESHPDHVPFVVQIPPPGDPKSVEEPDSDVSRRWSVLVRIFHVSYPFLGAVLVLRYVGGFLLTRRRRSKSVETT